MRKQRITYAARSDLGRVRRNNEDNLFCNGQFLSEEIRDLPFKASGLADMPAVFAVCDGMGGYQWGEQASLVAVQTLSDFSSRLVEASCVRLDDIVREYVCTVNQRINSAMQGQAYKMGATLALAVITEGVIKAYNIGDSRIYVFDKEGLRQISVDHTLAMKNVRSGLISEGEARRSSDWSKLTACLGFADDDGCDFRAEVLPTVPIRGEMRILLCSDGLTDMLPDESIEEILRTSRTAEQSVSKLMSDALNNGGSDNISIVVADIQDINKNIWRFFIDAVEGR